MTPEQFKIAQFSRIDVAMRSQCRMEVQALLKEDRYRDTRRLESFGFKVFSQNEEDGIIQEIFRRVGITNARFFEFGAGNGLESNCCYLLLQGWHGVWLDANRSYLEQARKLFSDSYEKQITIAQEFVYAATINELTEKFDVPKNVDLMSIDIDGNDYYVWEALTVIKPRVIIVEYNASFPPPVSLVQVHQPDHWNGTNYFGASLQALADLGMKKGYTLVGTNLSGVNAFFVRNDLAPAGRSLFASEAFETLDAGIKAEFDSVMLKYLYNPPRYTLGECGFPVGHPPGIGPMVTP